LFVSHDQSIANIDGGNLDRNGETGECASDSLHFFSRNLKDAVESCDPKQLLDVIRWPQEDQLAATASDRSQNSNQLSQAKAVDVGDIRQVQYKATVAFFQELIDLFVQSDFKETQSAGQVHNDGTGHHS
jgi:hypothetical protein